MTDRLEEIKKRADYSTIEEDWKHKRGDLNWLIKQVESQRAQLATLEARAGVTPDMVSEIEDAHRALDRLGVPNDGKSLLGERLKRSSTYTPVAEALTALYETWCKLGLQADETIETMSQLLRAYDEWLD